MALVLSNRGSKFIGSGRFADAGEALEDAARQQERLAVAYPGNDPLWSELAGTLDNLGVLARPPGRQGGVVVLLSARA